MKRTWIAITTLGLLLMAGIMLAESPHWVTTSDSVNSSLQLVVSFKEAGLGNITTTPISVSANATAVYQCFNNGGNHPKAGNKETVGGPISASANFPVRNGQTTGSFTLNPPSQGSFACPSGQTLYLVEADYTGVTIDGAAGPVTLPDVSGTGKVKVQ